MVRCSVPGCERDSVARGWCGGHYDRWRRTGDLRADEPLPPQRDDRCAAPGCERAASVRQHCSRHYKQIQRRGTVQEMPEPLECAVQDCARSAVERGWCHGHYLRWLRVGDVRADRPLRRPPARECSAQGCGRRTQARGLCGTHYKRWQKSGDPAPDDPVRVVTGEGHLSHGYWCVPVPAELRHLTGGEAKVGEHRLVMALHLGRALLPHENVHHVNGDRVDNRIENLELWSTMQPRGQQVRDKVAFAKEILRLYEPDCLRPGEAAS